MKLIWIYFLAFLILPIVGELLVYINDIDISAGKVSFDLILNNIFFVIIIISLVYLISSYKNKKYINSSYMYSLEYSKRVLSRLILIYIFVLILIFLLSGYSFLFNHEDRGYIRTHLGLLGPIYTFILNYLSFFLIIYSSLIYKQTIKKDFRLKLYLYLIFIFSILIGMFSGYKAVALNLIIAGVSVLYFDKFTFLKLISFFLFSIILLTMFTSLVRGESLQDSFYFIINRMTVMSAYGTIGVWNQFQSSISFNDLLYQFASIFGNKIASNILDIPQDSVEFLKTSLSKYITYLVYPNTKGALSGEVNVTVTAFGHAIYLFGRYLYILYAILIGIIIGLVFRYIIINIKRCNLEKSSIVLVIFFNVIIPSLNSTGIFGIFNIYVIVYLLLLYIFIIICIKTINKGVIYVAVYSNSM